MLELWAHINGNTYPIALGETLNDALGEELDSMNILIPHVRDFTLKPFDDIFITDSEEYPTREYGKLHIPDGENETFYRHFLVMNYDRREINNDDGIRWFNFSLALVSETKYFEKILLPNRTITNPLNAVGKSVYWMAEHFVERYTPKVKTTSDGSTWIYKPKFRVSTINDDSEYTRGRNLLSVESVFGKTECQECSFNNPNLREVLTRIFQTRNMIPVVLDNVVFCRDLNAKGNEIEEIKGKTWDSQTMSGEEYVDRLRKNYSQALTDSNGCVFHEYVGFRNITAPAMRYNELAVEVKNPIYKVNKFYLCFYSQRSEGKVIKLDLTSFLIPNSTRAFLSNDWIYFNSLNPQTINGYYDFNGDYVPGICDFRFNTVGYDIGGTTITGWGEQQKFTTDGLTFKQKIILENILNISVNLNTDFTIFEQDIKTIADNRDGIIDSPGPGIEYLTSDIMAPEADENVNFYSVLENFTSWIFNSGNEKSTTLGPSSLKMKTVFFEIEYQGMITSAVTVSKRLHDGDIMAIDNQQESLAITENDGAVSKIKVNRLGNKASSVSARVGSIEDLVSIGDYDDEHGICYKRTISIERDFIAANYYFSQDYVLMNYYTSVHSKYKSSAYASFSQSIERNETNDIQLLLSRDERYVSDNDYTRRMYGFGNRNLKDYRIKLKDVISLVDDEPDSLNHEIAYFYLKAPKQEQFSYSEYADSQVEYQAFTTDRAYYMSGDSMCMTMGMPDSETAGTYIKQWYPDTSSTTLDILNSLAGSQETASAYASYSKLDSPVNDITGTMQDYYSLPRKRYDGSLEDMFFIFAFTEESILDGMYKPNENNTRENILGYFGDQSNNFSGIQYQPKLPISKAYWTINRPENSFFFRYEPYKDAKEIINETFQIEPISEDGDIITTPWFLKLSNLYNRKEKRILDGETIEINDSVLLAVTDQIYNVYYNTPIALNTELRPVHSLGIYTIEGDFTLKNLESAKGKPIEKSIIFECDTDTNPNDTYMTSGNPKLEVIIHEIVNVALDYIDVDISMRTNDGFFSGSTIGLSPAMREYATFEIEHKITRWWNADQQRMIKNENRISDPSENYNFYPRSAISPRTHPNMYLDWSYFRGIFCVKNGNSTAADINLATHCQPTNRRLCFAFNFDSFPNGTTMNIYRIIDNDITFLESRTLNALYYSAFLTISSNGSGELVTPVAYAHAKTKNIELAKHSLGYYYPYEGPNKTQFFKLDKSLVSSSAINSNILWFISPNPPSNPDKKYSSEEELANDGYIKIRTDSGYTEIVENEGKLKYGATLDITDIEEYSALKQVSCFFYDSAKKTYNLALSWPIDSATVYDEEPNTLVIRASFYASLLHDRSKTVYDNETMRPDYEVRNEAGTTENSPKCESK